MGEQQNALDKVKQLLSTTPILTFYEIGKPTLVSADSSSYGLGGMLMQQHGYTWKPVAYCSLILMSAKTSYAQIGKECLAGVWTCILGNIFLDTCKAQNPRWPPSLMENTFPIFSMSDGSHLGFWALQVSNNLLPKIFV